MKSNYKMRAERFLKMIFPYIEACEYPYQYKRAMNHFNEEHSRKVIVRSGVSRVAIITSDYVIKFDYDMHEVKRVGGCQSEVDFYDFAKSEGFEYLFAEITPLEYCGRTFYIMPRIHGIGRKEYCYAEEFLHGEDEDFVRTYLYDLHDENYGWYHNRPIIVDYACNQLWLENNDEVSES